ncbi:hypothetical protein HNR46_004125 [Haloferula luteola]|uniref:Uncharacterized protein n=1 Tax=Haloferula luteola TaxID=595692 RepID=A0A840VMK5_9BACT|nr:hypothetical protein [Haloferula luteola]MBB5353861.1 hypothetical protein [Haloferula luteola]
MAKKLNPQPIHKVRFGHIQVSIWSNTDAEGTTFHTLSLERSYRLGEEWKSQTLTLRPNEVARVTGALQQVYADLHLHPDCASNPAREPLQRSA